MKQFLRSALALVHKAGKARPSSAPVRQARPQVEGLESRLALSGFYLLPSIQKVREPAARTDTLQPAPTYLLPAVQKVRPPAARTDSVQPLKTYVLPYIEQDPLRSLRVAGLFTTAPAQTHFVVYFPPPCLPPDW
jgi:hypothetical protein